MEKSFLEIVNLIKQSRIRAIKAVNSELIDLYWNIGKHISKKVEVSEWGNSVVKDLANFIQNKEPEIKGFSDKNLWRMKQFYETYKDESKLAPLVREISWTHNLIIMSRSKTMEEREFYIKLVQKESYSKRELERQISVGFFERTVLANSKLPSKLGNYKKDGTNSIKDNYIFEFLNLPDNHSESELQRGLVSEIRKVILELGKDFLFIAENYRLQVGKSDFYVDLLFYHRGLQCLVAFELKADRFKPSHLGQLNFYLEALDRDVKKPHENPSIGVLLCKDKDVEVVEYALSRSLSPTMVSEYKIQLPDKELLQRRLHEIFIDKNEEL